MIAAAGQKHFKRGESRLFETIWLAVHLTDAMAIAGLAMRGKLDIADEKQDMCFTCAGFPFEIFFPIVHPMKLTVANKRIDQIILEIKPKDPAPMAQGHDVAQFSQMYYRLGGIVYLRFYEQHRPHIQSTYGGDTKAWPQIFQFAWAIRNGITHHGGCVNFANPNYPPVTWYTYSYSRADNGKPIFDKQFNYADLLMFLFDLSDELDAINAPIPPD